MTTIRLNQKTPDIWQVSNAKPLYIGCFSFGGEAVEPDETERKQGNVIVKHSDIVHYVFLKGIAGIIAERYKQAKPLSPNLHLVFDEHGSFTKRS